MIRGLLSQQAERGEPLVREGSDSIEVVATERVPAALPAAGPCRCGGARRFVLVSGMPLE